MLTCLLVFACAMPVLAAGDRTFWQHSQGHFENNAGTNWIEVAPGNRRFDFVEKNRTEQYLDLYDQTRQCTVRLFDDRCMVKFGNGKFEKAYDGQWRRRVQSPRAPGKPAAATKQKLPGQAAEAPGAERPVLFDNDVPAEALLLLPTREPPFILPFTAYRAVVNVWGYPTAFLHYNGRYARGQFCREIGRAGVSLCVVERGEHESSVFLTQVLPIITSPKETANVALGPTQLIPPKAGALQTLRRNLLRAYFAPRVHGRDARAPDVRAELTREWIRQEQYNGLLHEAQHVFFQYGRRPSPPPTWENEERSHLTALRHSPSPQIALSQILKQYDSGEGIYYEAVRDILANLVRRIADRPKRYPRINSGQNIMAQLHALSGDELGELAGQIMRARWEAWDAARGLSLEYERPQRIDTTKGYRLEHAEPEFPAHAPQSARQIYVSAANGRPEARNAVLLANANQPALQETWGKTHWRLDGGAVLAAVFRPPASVKKATLKVVHMATVDSQGSGGKTLIRIHINDKTLVEAYAPPQEKDNRLERPESFDIGRFLQPGKANVIAIACDPRERSDLVYWVESFEMVIE
jgi:hypothetical protein